MQCSFSVCGFRPTSTEGIVQRMDNDKRNRDGKEASPNGARFKAELVQFDPTDFRLCLLRVNNQEEKKFSVVCVEDFDKEFWLNVPLKDNGHQSIYIWCTYRIHGLLMDIYPVHWSKSDPNVNNGVQLLIYGFFKLISRNTKFSETKFTSKVLFYTHLHDICQAITSFNPQAPPPPQVSHKSVPAQVSYSGEVTFGCYSSVPDGRFYENSGISKVSPPMSSDGNDEMGSGSNYSLNNSPFKFGNTTNQECPISQLSSSAYEFCLPVINDSFDGISKVPQSDVFSFGDISAEEHVREQERPISPLH